MDAEDGLKTDLPLRVLHVSGCPSCLDSKADCDGTRSRMPPTGIARRSRVVWLKAEANCGLFAWSDAFVTFFFLISLALAGQVDGAAADDRAAEVRRLVRQLDAAELSARNGAEEKLIGMGVEVLDRLPNQPGGSAEIELRLKRIRQTIEKQTAAVSVQGSAVSLAGSMRLSQALAAIEKQTGNKVVDYREQFGQQVTDPEVTTDFEKTPFWQALDTLLDRANMTTYNYAHDADLSLIAKSPEQLARAPRADYVGPLRLEVARVTAERVPGVKNSGSLKLALEIAWEPRLRPILFQQALASLKATDDRGHLVKPAQDEGELEAPAPQGTAVQMELPFELPPRSAKSIHSLKGSLTALMPGKIETFEFGDLAAAAKPDSKPVEKRIAAATVTLDDVRRNHEVWEV
ncbi:MAG: hypothetical protein IT427_06760, partial [Pirellulales bacterium]|nr:hypothetical protein [Pirellulales bacterium]